MFGKRRGHRYSSRSRKFPLKTTFLAVAAAAQLAISGAFGYAAAGGDWQTLAEAGMVVASSVLGGAFGAAVLGGGSVAVLSWLNRKGKTDGLADMASKVTVGGFLGACGYVAGSVAGPVMTMNMM